MKYKVVLALAIASFFMSGSIANAEGCAEGLQAQDYVDGDHIGTACRPAGESVMVEDYTQHDAFVENDTDDDGTAG